MSSPSIRTKLTTWYVAVLALAMLATAGGGWMLLRRSIVETADANLSARLDGVRTFIDHTERELPPTDVSDEFQEYAELTAGESLLEVTDAAGRTLCRPSMPHWEDVRVETSGAGTYAMRQVLGRPFRVAATSLVTERGRYQITVAMPMGPAYEALTRWGWWLALLLPLVAVLAGAGGSWISGRALAPVDRMTRAVKEISLSSLNRRLEVPTGDDELRRLATTFNEMLARLEGAVADMVRFTAEAAHELRTPVSVVRGTAELALARPRTTVEYHQALGEVLLESERMSVLVADLLALARADAGVDAPASAVVDLGDLAEEAARDFRSVCAQRGLTFDVQSTAGTVRGSRESLRRLIVILLDNATKYTPTGGAVRLRAERGRLEVADTGPGIDFDEQPRVFDRFYRGTAARLHPGGSGLGLSIARTIVERHGGAIRVQSAPPALGTVVEVRFPTA
jgi:heavy metal sensor kinase